MATIIDAFVGSCVQKLQDVITDEAILILGVKEELIELQGRMDQIKLFLYDAEQRRIENSAYDNWLSRLKDAIYDADDIIDVARFEGNKLLADPLSASSRKPAACSGCTPFYCFSYIRTRHEIGYKIRNVNNNIELIAKDKIFLTLESTQRIQKDIASKVGTVSSIVEPNLVGKDVMHASRKIVYLMLAHKGRKTYKVTIVGTGGIGKTTLAQKIYNDLKIRGVFDKHVWVSVSKMYSKDSVLRQILRNMHVRHDKEESIGELQRKLESSMREKSFFLVLDDVWSSDVWTNLLRTPLHAAATGTILITTRHDTIASEIGSDHTHRVELMSDDVGWELLWKSMNITEENHVYNLRDIGIKVVQKCGGLPLAIRVIASVLASKDQSRNEWKKILNKSAWSISNLPSEIRGALYLSYEELPQHLKQCFLYCVVYPEDSDIYLDDITRMWVAEGFIEEQEGQLLEDTAEQYYYELIHRNLLQPDYSYFVHTACKMHDLLRQLACYLSRDECFTGDPELLGGNTIRKLRCLSVDTEKDMVVLSSLAKKQVKLRTFANSCGKSLRVDNTFFRRIPYIRILDLADSFIQNIPDYIGNLIHLRLLVLVDTNISCLPESIGSLKNLQILNLRACDGLKVLPLAITKLDNLRCLCLYDTPINRVPNSIGRLKLLNDLDGFPVGGDISNTKTQDGWNLEELASLFYLRRLVMVKMERAVTSSAHSFLVDKKYLKILHLKCTAHTEEQYLKMDVRNIEKIFEQLVPPDNLDDLVIEGFFGQRSPTWLGTTYLSSLKYMNLIDCKSWMHLPPVGQLPDLKYLRIVGATAVNKIGPEFVGRFAGNLESTEFVAFPKLEWLIIDNLPNWEEWSFVEKIEVATATMNAAAVKHNGGNLFPMLQLLPRLEKLDLVRCPRLKAIPEQLAHATKLKTLQLRKLARLKVVENLPFLSDHLLITGCGCLKRVSNIPQVTKLSVRRCPNLNCVDNLGSLRQLSLGVSMQKISSRWVPGLEQQCRQLYGETLDVHIW